MTVRIVYTLVGSRWRAEIEGRAWAVVESTTRGMAAWALAARFALPLPTSIVEVESSNCRVVEERTFESEVPLLRRDASRDPA